MDDFTAQLLHALDRVGQVRYREVRKRETVARAAAAFVQPQGEAIVPAFPALARLGGAWLELDVEELLPEMTRALRLVGRELEQERGLYDGAPPSADWIFSIAAASASSPPPAAAETEWATSRTNDLYASSSDGALLSRI